MKRSFKSTVLFLLFASSVVCAQPVDWSQVTIWDSANTVPDFVTTGADVPGGPVQSINNFNGINGLTASISGLVQGVTQVGNVGPVGAGPNFDALMDDDGFDTSVTVIFTFNKPIDLTFFDLTTDENEFSFFSVTSGLITGVNESGFAINPMVTQTQTSVRINGADSTANSMDNVVEIEAEGITGFSYLYDSSATFPLPGNSNFFRIESLVCSVPEPSCGFPLAIALAIFYAQRRKR